MIGVTILPSIIIPAISAPLAYFVSKKSGKAGCIVCLLASIVSLLLLTIGFATNQPLYREVYKAWMPSPVGGYFEAGFFVDGVSYLMSMATLILFALSMIYSEAYIGRSKPSYYAIMLMLLTGLLGVFLSSNLILFYIFWEFMLLPSYFIIGEWGYRDPKKVAFKFFIFTHAGALVTLVGIAIAYATLLGNLDIFQMAQAAAVSEEWKNIWVLPFTLVVIGFIVKLGAFPFYTWLPDAHGEAPAPMSALLSGIIIETGAYAIYRIGIQTFVVPVMGLENVPTVLQWLAILGITSAIYGGFLALRETDIKRLVAYSSVSQAGYMIAGLGVGAAALAPYVSGQGPLDPGGVLALAGVLFHLVAHSWSKGLLFLVSGSVMHQTHKRDITEMGMLLHKMPATGFAGFVSSFSIAGAPPFPVFWGEIMMIIGAAMSNITYAKLIAGLLALATVFSAAYMLRFWLYVFWRRKPEAGSVDEVKEAPLAMSGSMVLLAVLLILIGILPGLLFTYIYQTINILLGM